MHRRSVYLPGVRVMSKTENLMRNCRRSNRQTVSVLLSLDFNKTVSELKVYYKQNDNWVEDNGTFSKTGIELGGRKGNVEFFAAVPGMVKIVATSPNGVSGEMTDIDLVDIIDKKCTDDHSDTETGKQPDERYLPLR